MNDTDVSADPLGKLATIASAVLAALVVAAPVIALIAFIVGWGVIGMWDGDLGGVIGIVIGIVLGSLIPPLTLGSSVLGVGLAGLGVVRGYRRAGLALVLFHSFIGVLSGIVLLTLTIPIFTS
ncbi:MAG: hypothetical protein H6739_19450 [Alphaproteobacteria bacterium]|nr:hypothetical protein [Alphaproteobacteria bacterium]